MNDPAVHIKTYSHLEYEMHCGARVLDNGRFVPTLSIVKQVWPTRPREVAMARGDFASEEEAIGAARAQGIAWIANYG